MKVTNWGKYPVSDAELRRFSGAAEARRHIAGWDHYIPRGLGRCYGDSALADHILDTTRHERFLDFNPETGLLTCEAGVSLAEIIRIFLPRGWFLPVTPGTKFVTLGGAIAADVHGKNHHSDGSFGRYVERFSLMLPSGEVIECSRNENPEIFRATLGGQGLTGLLLDASFRMRAVETCWIKEDSLRVKNLDEALARFEESMHYTYSVAWLDCLSRGKSLGRSIILNGEHAKMEDLKTEKQRKNPLILPRKGTKSVPFNLPGFTINNLSISLFNFFFYYKKSAKPKSHLVDLDTYFYPLDGVHHWNRVYGKRGFMQYQFVIPPERGVEGMREILRHISKRRYGSFLTVLKWLGEKEEGYMSFPQKGLTLALDFPRTRKLPVFLNELDELVKSFGGRIYLTKDARMSPEMLRFGYEELEKFEAIRKQIDPKGKMRSLQSARLKI